MLAIDTPFRQFYDLDGDPLASGYLYFGEAFQNPETNPITVYWDAAGTQPAAQPIRTKNGYPVRAGKPAMVFAGQDYSLTVRNRQKGLVIYAPNSLDYSLLDYLGTEAGAASIVFQQAGVGAAVRNLLTKLRETKSVTDFDGVVGDGVNDDTAGIQAALNACLNLDFGDNTKNYRITGTLVVRSYSQLRFNGARMFQETLQTPLLNCKNTSNVTITGGVFTGVPMSVVTAGGFVVGRKYTIVSVGTTNFVALGAASNTPGVVFTASAAGSGTGTATTLYNNPNSQDIGIAADYAINLRVRDNTFIGFGYSPLMAAFWATNIWFETNTVTGCGQTVLNPLGGDPSIPGLRNSTGCTILGYGVYIIGNTFSDTSQGLIVGQQSRDVHIVGNTIKRTWVEHGMYVDTSCRHVVIEGNTVSNTALIGIKSQHYDAYVTAPSIRAGNTYIIKSVGTTDFTLIGAASNTVGVEFFATGTGSGSGQAWFDYSADLVIKGNTVENTGGDGIIVLNAGTAEIATLTGVTNANPGVFTTSAAHNLAVNDVIQITGVVGMTTVNAMYYVASVPTGSTFTVKVNGVPLDTTDTGVFPAYVSGGSIARPMFQRTCNIVGNTLRNIGQDAIGVRYVNGGTVGLNVVDGVERAGVYVLYGRTLDINNNLVKNCGTNGIYALLPTDRAAITDNTLLNTGSDGTDLGGLSTGILVDGSGGAELDNNTITGAAAVTMGTITGITQANPGVFTTAAPHGLLPGQIVAITGVTGMTAVNGAQTIFSTPTPTTFTVGVGVPLDTSALPAFAGGGVVTIVKMQYGVYIASGDKRQYTVRKNTVTMARDAGMRCHTEDTNPLGYLGDDNVWEASTGSNAIVGLPAGPGRGSPNPKYYGTTLPASGFWVQGTRFEILYPAAGSIAEYVRVTSGTNPADWAPCAPLQVANAYTVTNPSTDRALNVSADTTAQVAAVLGTLIADLKLNGILK